MKASQCNLPSCDVITVYFTLMSSNHNDLTICDIIPLYILPSKHTYDLITVYLTLQELFKSMVTKSKIILAKPRA